MHQLMERDVVSPKQNQKLIWKTSLSKYLFGWKNIKPSTHPSPTLWVFFSPSKSSVFSSVWLLKPIMSHDQAERSCEKLWATLEIFSPFSSSNLPGCFFCWVAYFTQMRRKFIKRDNQTRMGRIKTEHANYVFGWGGNLSSVDLPLFFSGGVMFYRLPWKIEKTCYKQMHAQNEWALEKVNQTGTAT